MIKEDYGLQRSSGIPWNRKGPTTIEAYASLDGLTLQLRRVSNASKDLPTRKAVDHE